MTTATWIAVALLTPFWWAMGLFILAVLGDLSPGWRTRASRLFDWLECSHVESPNAPAIAEVLAA